MEINKVCAETDEDDYETYFLQPASSPYNIAEKVKEANETLFNETLVEKFKECRVKFKEDLVDFEPDVTDDDVTSIESYNEVVDLSNIHQNETFALELHSCKESCQNINIFETVNEEDDEIEDDYAKHDNSNSSSELKNVIDKTNDIEELENKNLEDSEHGTDDVDDTTTAYSHISEECEEDIIEEVDEILCGEEVKEKHIFKQKTIDLDIEDELSDLIQSPEDDVTFKVETNVKDQKLSSPKLTYNRKKIPVKFSPKPHIECKNHCIEKLEPGLNLYINKLNIREKPPRDCPALKLQKRNCCDKNPVKLEQKLPVYSGHKSEYGLSLMQLERKDKMKLASKLRESKRYEIMEEFKVRKMQQNEEIFCQWLKDISRRKKETEIKNMQSKKCVTPTLFPFPASKNEPAKGRPMTAQLLPSHVPKKSKRPHTSTACVYIEVPQHILRRGIRVDNVLVDKNHKMDAKKLHILTFS